MEDLLLTGAFLVILFGLLGSGVWVGLSLIATALIGMEMFTTRPVGPAMTTTIWSDSSSWTLTCRCSFGWARSSSARNYRRTSFAACRPGWVGCLAGCCT